jgi:hypothetical protein
MMHRVAPPNAHAPAPRAHVAVGRNRCISVVMGSFAESSAAASSGAPSSSVKIAMIAEAVNNTALLALVKRVAESLVRRLVVLHPGTHALAQRGRALPTARLCAACRARW